jgi:ribosome maturation factor RimP
MRGEASKAADVHGCMLWDIEFVREAGQLILRLYIDREGGVAIDQCEAVSKSFEAWLDEADPIPDSYVLEVSSAGLTRTLKRPEDFPRFIGHRVDVRLFKAEHGAKGYTGILRGRDEETLTLELDGKRITFAAANVSIVKLNPIF